MIKKLQPVVIGGKEVYPLIDGGKGISFTNGTSAGLWAKQGGIGTFSAAAADHYDLQGNIVPYTFKSTNRIDKHDELIQLEIAGGIAQAEKAYLLADGNGLINLNILWEMGGTKRILHGVLEKAAHFIDGITAGAGIPYELGKIAMQYNIGFYPIVSSERAFRLLWQRSYADYREKLYGVVYEDPWKAGGHNGISNKENPLVPEPPLERVKAIRKFMNTVGLDHVPIIMAGNVWHLNEWEDFLNDPELQPIAFQFGTRTLVTQENPAQHDMKMYYLSAGEKGIPVILHNFSPTGMYSSALQNSFLKKLEGRKERQVQYSRTPTDICNAALAIGDRGRTIYIPETEKSKVQAWIENGHTHAMPTPDHTMIFVSEHESKSILQDQRDCKGCLKGCKFSGWYEEPDNNHSTGVPADPRSFCIFNTLYGMSHGNNVEHDLMFAGHTVYRFSSDPFYRNPDGSYKIPTIEELFNRILTGE